MDFFSKKLLKWYSLNKRELPWRGINDPYKIWLSEIILQQTRVNQGLEYYLRFVNTYPTVSKLAKANLDEVMKLWQGLGYYSRARNLYETAVTVVNKYHSVFPADFNELKKLKGIGDYTAAAIASFAYNLPHAVVDGNVFRLLSRFFGIKTPIDSAVGKKYFNALANELLPEGKAAEYNQAIMEFGALYCTPDKPDCLNCVFSNQCVAFEKKIVRQLPVKEKKIKITNRYFHYLVMVYKNDTFMRKRDQKDIWRGLYEFELIETGKKVSADQLFKHTDAEKVLKKTNYSVLKISKEYKHVLSHQRLYATFYLLKVKSPPVSKTLKKIKIKQIQKVAMPKLIENYLIETELDK